MPSRLNPMGTACMAICGHHDATGRSNLAASAEANQAIIRVDDQGQQN
jgi:hypothetical protein